MVKNWRYERKFVISNMSKQEVESIVKFHPAMFREIYSERSINNIYFDSLDYGNYFDNDVGANRRMKIRIRWYGNMSHADIKPVLEIKLKNNNLGGKLQYPLPGLKIRDHIDEKELKEWIRKSDIPERVRIGINDWEIKNINRYSRKYFQAKEKDFRITLDSGLVYFNCIKRKNYLHQKVSDEKTVILELKYGEDFDRWAAEITNLFPFRVTKNSKYISGVEYLFR